MKFNLPKFEVPKVPSFSSNRGAEGSKSSESRPQNKQPGSGVGFGAKSREQVSNFIQRTRRTLTPTRSRSKKEKPSSGSATDVPQGTELQKSNSDSHVTNLKGILKASASKSEQDERSPERAVQDQDTFFSSTSSEMGFSTRPGDLKSVESGSRSTMGMARELSQSSIIERVKAADGTETFSRPPRPPPPKRFQRKKPNIRQQGSESPTRPSRRKEPVGQRHLRVNQDIPYMEDGETEVPEENVQQSYPCPFLFETHDTFADSEAFVEMLTQNILKDSWDDYKGQILPNSNSARSTSQTLWKLPQSTQEVGASLIKALELQVEIENKLKEDRDTRERRMRDIESWEQEIRSIQIPPSSSAGCWDSHSASSSRVMMASQSLDRRRLRPASAHTIITTDSQAAGNNNNNNRAWMRSSTLPRPPRPPVRTKNKVSSRSSLPDYKRINMERRPLPAPPTPPKLRTALPPMPAPRTIFFPSSAGNNNNNNNNNKSSSMTIPIRASAMESSDSLMNTQHPQDVMVPAGNVIQDIPRGVIQAIVEISRGVFMEAAIDKDRTVKELGQGLSVPELKVGRLSVEELSAVRVIVNNLAAKHAASASFDSSAKIGQIYAKSSRVPLMMENNNNEEKNADDLSHVSTDDVSKTEDFSKTEDISKTDDVTTTFESLPGETTESSATFDTDCESDLEGSIKSVEIVFDAIEGTLQTFQDTIASGPETQQ